MIIIVCIGVSVTVSPQADTADRLGATVDVHGPSTCVTIISVSNLPLVG